MGIIYKLTSPKSKVYIGQCKRKHRQRRTELPPQKQMGLRWAEHCRKTSGCCAIKNAIAKYGPEAFKVEILVVVPDDMLNAYEKKFVALYDSTNPKLGYNRNDGGEGGGFGIPAVRKAQCQPGSKWMLAVTDKDVVAKKIVGMHSEQTRQKVAAIKAEKTAVAIATLPEAEQAAAAAKKKRLREATARYRARQRGDMGVECAKRKRGGFRRGSYHKQA